MDVVIAFIAKNSQSIHASFLNSCDTECWLDEGKSSSALIKSQLESMWTAGRIESENQSS